MAHCVGGSEARVRGEGAEQCAAWMQPEQATDVGQRAPCISTHRVVLGRCHRHVEDRVAGFLVSLVVLVRAHGLNKQRGPALVLAGDLDKHVAQLQLLAGIIGQLHHALDLRGDSCRSKARPRGVNSPGLTAGRDCTEHQPSSHLKHVGRVDALGLGERECLIEFCVLSGHGHGRELGGQGKHSRLRRGLAWASHRDGGLDALRVLARGREAPLDAPLVHALDTCLGEVQRAGGARVRAHT
jgi:hypothetical protein